MLKFFKFVLPILLFVVPGIISQRDHCNLIFYDLPRKCFCRWSELRCSELNDDDIYDLTRAIQGPRQELRFNIIELREFDLTSLPSVAFKNVDTDFLLLSNGVFDGNTSDSRAFFNSFPSMTKLDIQNVETFDSESSWRDFLPVKKNNLYQLAIAGEHFSQLWEDFPWTIAPNLERLILQNTSVTQLSSSILYCPRCYDIQVHGGSLEIIKPYTFQRCLELKSLYLDYNMLTSLPGYAFAGHELNIGYISLRENQLRYLSPESFYGVSRTASIDLRGQRLDCDCYYTWLDSYIKLQYPDCTEHGWNHWNLKNFFEAYCRPTYSTTETSTTYSTTETSTTYSTTETSTTYSSTEISSQGTTESSTPYDYWETVSWDLT